MAIYNQPAFNKEK